MCIAGSAGSAHRSTGNGDVNVNEMDQVVKVESFPFDIGLCMLTTFYWLRANEFWTLSAGMKHALYPQ
jgi:hypothetical protein